MARQILRIDMSNQTFKYEPVPAKWARWGGRAMTSAICAMK
jgi:hypothetical protein